MAKHEWNYPHYKKEKAKKANYESVYPHCREDNHEIADKIMDEWCVRVIEQGKSVGLDIIREKLK